MKLKETYLLIIVMLFVSIGCNPSNKTLPAGSDSLDFDSKLWKKESSTKWQEGEVSEREKMLKDLVENVLPRKNKEEIEGLLGPSLKTNYFQSIDEDMIYYLGPERDNYFGNIDSEWLLIWTDKNGIFLRYAIMND